MQNEANIYIQQLPADAVNIPLYIIIKDTLACKQMKDYICFYSCVPQFNIQR